MTVTQTQVIQEQITALQDKNTSIQANATSSIDQNNLQIQTLQAQLAAITSSTSGSSTPG